MKIVYKRRFLRDLERLPNAAKARIQAIVFSELPQAEQLEQIQGLRKLHGDRQFYRLRHGDYRIGLAVQEDRLVVCRVLHRKDIYRYFP